MKKLLLAMFLTLVACSEKAEPQKVHYEPPPPPPPVVVPVSTNPFDKPPPPLPVLPVQPFKSPTFQMVKELKMNEDWTVFVWRDEANNVTCYFYCIRGSIQNGISCVK